LPYKFSFYEVHVVFIKTEIIPLSKFHLKLYETPHQHKSNCIMCLIINFLIFLKQLKILKNYYYYFLNKGQNIKNFGVSPWVAGPPPCGRWDQKGTLRGHDLMIRSLLSCTESTINKIMKYPDGDFNQMLQNLQQQQQKLNKTSKTHNYNSCVR
jgi:hypothetical protein